MQPAGSLSALTEALVEKHKLGFPIAYGADAERFFAAAGAYGAAMEQSQRRRGVPHFVETPGAFKTFMANC
jgi:hypothetical protein